METYRILAQGQTVSNDTWATGLNNNDLIIGPSGAGKTRGYVLPNILQAILAAIPVQTVRTGHLTACMVSYSARPLLISPPGLLIYMVISFSGSTRCK